LALVDGDQVMSLLVGLLLLALPLAFTLAHLGEGLTENFAVD
jgi:hypothetical protein